MSGDILMLAQAASGAGDERGCVVLVSLMMGFLVFAVGKKGQRQT